MTVLPTRLPLGSRAGLPRLGRLARGRAREAARETAAFSRGLARGSVNLALAVYALALGAGLGLASAEWATRGPYPFGAATIGVWRTWPKVGATDADPYIRAINARQGEIPLAAGEGLRLVAATDTQGRALDPACTYRVGGRTPSARAWTFAAVPTGTPPTGAQPVAGARRTAFTSTEILREADGGFAILVSPEVQAGNWLPAPVDAAGRLSPGMRLVLQLYDTPAAANIGTLEPGLVPAVVRLGCAA